MPITALTEYPSDSLESIGADGAFQVGDGSGYGQNDNEATIKKMYTPTVPTPGNAIGLLQKELTKMPLEALSFFKDMLPDVVEGAFDTVGGAVQAIIAGLSSAVTFLTSGQFAAWVGSTFNNLATEARQVFDVLSGAIVTPITAAVQAVKDWWFALTAKTSKLTATGGYQASQLIGQVGKDAVEGLTDLGVNVAGFFKGIYDKWFGVTSGAGTLTQATYTIEAIKDAVISGYNVSTFTSDTVNWQVPSPLPIEVLGILIGGGQNGGAGGDGSPGLSGSYVVIPLTLTGVTALDIKIGTPGNFSYIRVANPSAPHTGYILAQSAAFGSAGGVAGPLGFTTTASSAGNGGRGALGSTPSTPGDPSTAATGGIAGPSTGNFGTNGGDGGSVSAGAQVKCGGAGGGGGGKANTGYNQGGRGGSGGYPGGGGGGTGSSNAAPQRPGGLGAPGVVWIFSKGAAPTP